MRTEEKLIEFDWNEGNIGKNKIHNVEDKEAEEVFLDEDKFIFKDVLHSQKEERLRILGITKEGKLLLVVFTKRGRKIRIISARDINKKEVKLYEKATKATKV